MSLDNLENLVEGYVGCHRSSTLSPRLYLGTAIGS